MQLVGPGTAPASAEHPERLAVAKVIGEAIRDLAGMRRLIERELVCEVSVAALSLLAVVERRGPLRVSEVAELLDVDLSVASRHTSALEHRGLVLRQPVQGDRRAHLVTLTNSGAQTLEQARRWLAGRLDASLAGWSLDRLSELAGSLAQLRADLMTFLQTELGTTDLGSPDQPAPTSGDTTE
jgi:DNA-binding MarR family transcriptional regulator